MRVTTIALIHCLAGCGVLSNARIAGAQLAPAPPTPMVTPSQSLSQADTGTHLRAWRKDRFARPRYLEGALGRVTPESLAIRSARRNVVISLALDSISKLEIATGRADRTRTIVMTSSVGALAGLWVGFEAGVIITGLCEWTCEGERGMRVALAIAGTLMGAAAGAVIGAMIPPGRTWREVSVPH